MRAPVSQISAAALPARTDPSTLPAMSRGEQLALVAALAQRAHDAGASRLGMTSVLLEHKGEVLSDEFGTRDPALARSPREQPIVH